MNLEAIKSHLRDIAHLHGQGTKVAEYAEHGPYHCEDCIFMVGELSEGRGLCKQKVMLEDEQVPTDPKTKFKIVNIVHGCCRFVEPPTK